MEKNSGMKLKLFSLWPPGNGQIPLVLFPLYIMRKLALYAAFSPPPGCDTPYLGPLYHNELTGNKNKMIVPEIQSAIVSHFHKLGFNFIKFRTSPGQPDNRGFLWKGFMVRPQYEYEFAINNKKDRLFQSFPGDTRTKIRRAQKYDELEFEFGGIENAVKVYTMVLERFREQDINWPVKESFIRAIFKEFHPENIQVVLAKFNGEPVSGLIFFKYSNTLVDWIGGMSPRQNISGLNELMHWKIIEWGQENNCTVYNLGGANTPHLCKPKLKYNPELVLYSEVLKGSSIFEFMNKTATLPIIRNLLHKFK